MQESISCQQFSRAEEALAQRLKPILRALEHCGSQRTIIAIDGPCGSGKSTLAALLSRLVNCPLVHMDDFHIPHAQKTADRLAQPGGNSDRTRLIQEVLQPWRSTGYAVYRPYDCSADCLAAPVTLSDSPVLILEGSYSHHPELSALTDLRVFVCVSKKEQLRRIEHRSPEKLPMFISRWIPLEEAYFSAFSLPDEGALVISNPSLQGM